MAVVLTAAQARKLGLEVPATVRVRKRDRSTARGPYHTRCHACGDEFTTQASETRHNAEQGHSRFQLVLDEADR